MPTLFYLLILMQFKLRLFILFVAILSVSVSASADTEMQDFKSGGIYYKYLDGKDGSSVAVCARLPYYNEYQGDVVIPETVTHNSKQYKVEAIYEYAFFDCPELTSVTIPSTVSSVGDYAFSQSNGISSIVLPASVKKIGKFAFSGCKGLATVNAPEIESIDNRAFAGCIALKSFFIARTVNDIGDYVFDSCSSLNSFEVESGNVVYSSDMDALYENNTFKAYPAGRKGSYSIKDGTMDIAPGAFSSAKKIEEITIPLSVERIGDFALMGCTALTNIRIENRDCILGSAWAFNAGTKECVLYTYSTLKDAVAQSWTHWWQAIDTGERIDYNPPEPEEPEDPDVPQESYSVYFDLENSGWETVYAYVWDADNGNKEYAGAWPGTEMTYSSAYDLYECTFKTSDTPSGLKVVFNNGRGDQSRPDFDYVLNGIFTKSGYTGNDVPTAGIAEIPMSDGETTAEYFTITGLRVNNPSNGIFIRRTNRSIEKILIH